jgi:hypothetical protein
VGLSLVVAGLGGSRSEKRAVGLSGKGGWPWLSAGGGGGKKRKKKKKISRRADPSWVSGGGGKPRPKKISHAVPTQLVVSGGEGSCYVHTMV